MAGLDLNNLLMAAQHLPVQGALTLQGQVIFNILVANTDTLAKTIPYCLVISGHKTLSEMQSYITDANREIIADSAMERLMTRQKGEQSVVNFTQILAWKRHNTLKPNDD